MPAAWAPPLLVAASPAVRDGHAAGGVQCCDDLLAFLPCNHEDSLWGLNRQRQGGVDGTRRFGVGHDVRQTRTRSRTTLTQTVLPVYASSSIAAIVLAMKRSTTLVRRIPLQRSALSRRRAPILSAAEQKNDRCRDAANARRQVQDRDGCCVLCGGSGTDAHHRLPRGKGGATCDPSRSALSRLVWLCRECHCWVESRRTLAYGLGLLVRHGVTPCSAVPVFRHCRWVLLTDDGLVTPTAVPARVGGNFAESCAAS